MTSDLIETNSSVLQPSAVSLQFPGAAQANAVCAVCRRRPAAYVCDNCERKVCDLCLVQSSLLPLSRFCSEECRGEAELAAEQARQSDPYARSR